MEPVLLPKQVLLVTILLELTAGFTVTVTVKLAPAHDPEVGITVYVTVAGLVVVLISV